MPRLRGRLVGSISRLDALLIVDDDAGDRAEDERAHRNQHDDKGKSDQWI